MPLPQPKSSPDETPGASRIVITKVFVRGLAVDAHIGVYRHEEGRTQRLIVDVELDVAVSNWNKLSETVNYERIAEKARKVAAEGHRGLVETFAHHLADACLEEPKVTRARIRVEKPSALAPDAAAAGVEITAVRG
jgi:dihydroneopterin aldolase